MLSQITYGALLIAATVLVHAICLEWIMKIWRSLGMEIIVKWRIAVLSLGVIGIFIAHVTEIGMWAVFYYFFTEIKTWESALYFSATSFTTVGYGDLTLSEKWRLLGSIEAINGMILFGWSTALLFAGVNRIYDYLNRQADAPPGGGARSAGGYFFSLPSVMLLSGPPFSVAPGADRVMARPTSTVWRTASSALYSVRPSGQGGPPTWFSRTSPGCP